LYDILQTLEVIPMQGARDRGSDSFIIEGRGASSVSHAEAGLENGQIKGFILVWPLGDEDRRARVLAQMQAGFIRTEDVLDPAAGGDAAQNIDLVSGLKLRKPRLSRSGFFVDATGHVVTTAEAATGCTRITLDTETDAKVLVVDAASGIAVLRPERQLAPMAVARLRDGAPRLQSEVTLAGYAYEGALGAPTLSFGTLADVRGLNGEAGMARLALDALPGDAGGPVLDGGGGVLGMLLPGGSGDRQLPPGVSFAADVATLRAVLDRAGVRAAAETGSVSMAPADLTRLAQGMTVLVGCWD
jgi:S1-C subfamily serine protease